MKNIYEVDGDISRIYLTRKNGDLYLTTVDTENLQELIDISGEEGGRWYPRINGSKVYAKNRRGQYMHRVIMKVTDPKDFVDHINHDGLCNTKNNLRIVDLKENCRNRSGAPKNNTSGLMGVSWSSQEKKWKATIKVDGKRIFLGYHKEKYEAGREYTKARLHYFGSHGVQRIPIQIS